MNINDNQVQEAPAPLFKSLIQHNDNEDYLDLDDDPSSLVIHAEGKQGVNSGRKLVKRVEEIRKKLAYLHWRKVENSMQIKHILTTTKQNEDRNVLLKLAREVNQETRSSRRQHQNDGVASR